MLFIRYTSKIWRFYQYLPLISIVNVCAVHRRHLFVDTGLGQIPWSEISVFQAPILSAKYLVSCNRNDSIRTKLYINDFQFLSIFMVVSNHLWNILLDKQHIQWENQKQSKQHTIACHILSAVYAMEPCIHAYSPWGDTVYLFYSNHHRK